MSKVYTINGIGLNNIVYFGSKKAALNYAAKHNLPKLSNGYWGLIKESNNMAYLFREDCRKLKARIDKQEEQRLIDLEKNHRRIQMTKLIACKLLLDSEEDFYEE